MPSILFHIIVNIYQFKSNSRYKLKHDAHKLESNPQLYNPRV